MTATQVGLLDEAVELGAASNIGSPWPGSKMKGMPGRGELLRMLDHALAAVRSHDAEGDRRPHVRHLVEVRMLHGARDGRP